MSSVSMEEFVKKSLELIEKERNAEIEENSLLQEQLSLKELQRRGVCLLKLRITGHHTGLYGRTVVVFEPFWDSKELPTHKFTPGDIAGLQLSQGSWTPDDVLASGIVSCATANSLQVAFEEAFDQLPVDSQTQYKLLRLANDVTYRRLKRSLEELSGSENRTLVSVLFGQTEPGPPTSKARDGTDLDVVLYNNSLDASQQEAVKFALMQRELAIIHGPPGTGKTTTVTEIILQSVKQGNKLLVCAPSNIAVDNLVEKLSHYKTRIVRLGHPARVLPSIQKYSLDAILAHSDQTQLVVDVKKDIDNSLSQMKKTNDKGERQRLKIELRHLRKELRVREAKAIKDILHKAEVVLSTLTMATTEGPLKYMENQQFDVVVIDECSQALEAACWIAIQRGSKCILAGDHNQLPPTIISHEAAKEGLSFTLMERLLKLYGDKVMRMLKTQYRMHEDIMQWPSEQLYDGKLIAHHSVANHLLKDLDGIQDTDITSIPLLLIDTAGCDLQELNLVDELSKGNEGEADVVAFHIHLLVKCGLQPKDIAVIAPYNLQVELLRIRLSETYPALEIKSVDGFQGREKEAVIISLVRSNEKGEVGFLAEDRRINVAITRARRHLVVVCDSETVSHHKFLKDMVDYMTEKGEVKSAQEYIQAGALENDHKRPGYLDDRIASSHIKENHKVEAEKSKKAAKASKMGKKQKENQTHLRPSTSSQPVSKEEKNVDSTSDWTFDVIDKCITDFLVNDNMESYAFPSTLNASERKSVHEMCEKLGLKHVSVGIGTKRHIVISKAAKCAKEVPSSQHSSSAEQRTESQEEDPVLGHEVKKDLRQKTEIDTPQVQVDIKCDKCSKLIPTSNYELHNLRCSGPQQVATKPKKKPKSAKTKPLVNKDTDCEDFDSLIAEAVKQNTTCHYPKCKNNAATLGQNCQFCAKRFCLTHFIAEAHGCGDAVRAHARATVIREGVLYRGSGVPDKKPDHTKRAHLERKLNKKLEELTEKRKSKKKS